jgi:hypothetical protein
VTCENFAILPHATPLGFRDLKCLLCYKHFIPTGLDSSKLANEKHKAVWDGKNESRERVASGVYVYEMRAGEFVGQRKMTLMR